MERSGEKNPMWKGGIKSKSVCIVCGSVKMDRVPRILCSNSCKYKWLGRHNSIKMKGKTGSLASNWQGGKFSQSNYRGLSKYLWWRNEIYKLNGKICSECGLKENLQIDHIKPLSIVIIQNNIKNVTDFLQCKEVWEIKNGRVLCKKCHKIKQNSWKNLKKIKSIVS
jgi:5-methylcytosine-specific restriction endonuclease McrA